MNELANQTRRSRHSSVQTPFKNSDQNAYVVQHASALLALAIWLSITLKFSFPRSVFDVFQVLSTRRGYLITRLSNARCREISLLVGDIATVFH